MHVATWGQFLALYEPLVLQFRLQTGTAGCDAADLKQIVLQAVTELRLQWLE